MLDGTSKWNLSINSRLTIFSQIVVAFIALLSRTIGAIMDSGGPAGRPINNAKPVEVGCGEQII